MIKKTAKRILRGPVNRWKFRAYLKGGGPKKLNLGCGGNIMQGWLNCDLDYSRATAYMDLTRAFPLPDKSFDIVFAEHVIEHLGLAEFKGFLRETARVLKPGGVVRLATPDLDFYLSLSSGEETEDKRSFKAWLAKRKGVPDDGLIPVYAVNFMFEHGHRFVFNEPFLRSCLVEAGFGGVRRFRAGESDNPDLAGVEGHGKVPDVGEAVNAMETLVLEARLAV